MKKLVVVVITAGALAVNTMTASASVPAGVSCKHPGFRTQTCVIHSKHPGIRDIPPVRTAPPEPLLPFRWMR